MKKAIIIQPGKMGDLILMMPIAKFYNELGYKVDFPTFSNFKNFFANIDYVNHIDFNIKFNNNIEYVRVELTGPAEPAFSIDNPKSCYNDIVYSSNFYVNDLKLTLDTSTTAYIPMFQFVITR